MGERRTLTEGLRLTQGAEAAIEKQFVYGEKVVERAARQTTPHARVPISTRMRSDFAVALKRASLERQLAAVEPNTLQDILEEAIEPWLRTNGYLT
jgi:hypothetical protein